MSSRWRRWGQFSLIVGILIVVILLVWRGQISRMALVMFIRSCDVPADAEDRLIAMVRGDDFRDVTVPFVRYLHDLYGASMTGEAETIDDLAYDEPAPAVEAESRPGLSQLVQESPALRKHVATALRLFDALFLQVKPGASRLGARDRFDEAAYEDVKEIIRELIAEMLPKSDDALSRDTHENEYVAALNKLLNDDARLTTFVEFFTDFIREISDSWQRSYLRQIERKKRRTKWVEECMAGKRFGEILDYVRSRSRRRMVVHVVVDGLQGKLLEGLVQLSSGDKEGAGARYVAELIELHQAAHMQPASVLGKDLIRLAAEASNRPDYLENFKKYFFSPQAPAVSVNVATVDTPSISVRNLPIVKTGHPVAGPFGTGIPNFSYLDRRTGRGWYFWGSDVLHLQDIARNQEDRISSGKKRSEGPGARTLFERLPHLNTVSCMATLDAGALEKISSEVGVAVGELQRNFIEKTIILRFRRRARMERELNRRRRWLLDQGRDPTSLRTFKEHALFLAEHDDEGMPDYVLWYNPWPDHFAHAEGPYSDAIIGFKGEYDRLDFYLGKLIDIYRSVSTPDGDATYADRTLFGLASDHGLVHSPQHIETDKELFGALAADGIPVKFRKLTHDEGELPAIHDRNGMTQTRPYDAVVGSTAGGSYIIDLFDIEGLLGDDTAWKRHPGYHQLRRHPLLEGAASERKTVDWIARLKHHLKETMDLAVVREFGPSAGEVWPADQIESVVRIVTPDRGEARIYRLRARGADGRETRRYRYELLGESDPLGLVDSVRGYLIPAGGPSVDEVREELRRCIASAEGFADDRWRELLSYTLRPDSVYQLSHLYDSDRAGTINVFPVRHVGMNSEVPGRHAGEAFGEKNGTQLYYGAGLKRGWIQTARNGSLPVTLYHWLVGDVTFNAADPETGVAPAAQFGYPSLLLTEPAFAPIR